MSRAATRLLAGLVLPVLLMLTASCGWHEVSADGTARPAEARLSGQVLTDDGKPAAGSVLVYSQTNAIEAVGQAVAALGSLGASCIAGFCGGGETTGKIRDGRYEVAAPGSSEGLLLLARGPRQRDGAPGSETALRLAAPVPSSAVPTLRLWTGRVTTSTDGYRIRLAWSAPPPALGRLTRTTVRVLSGKGIAQLIEPVRPGATSATLDRRLLRNLDSRSITVEIRATTPAGEVDYSAPAVLAPPPVVPVSAGAQCVATLPAGQSLPVKDPCTVTSDSSPFTFKGDAEGACRAAASTTCKGVDPLTDPVSATVDLGARTPVASVTAPGCQGRLILSLGDELGRLRTVATLGDVPRPSLFPPSPYAAFDFTPRTVRYLRLTGTNGGISQCHRIAAWPTRPIDQESSTQAAR